MKLQPFINKPIGGLNLDANPNEVPPTDYLDGYDIVDRNPRVKNEKTLAQPENNNKLAYDLGEAELTKKKYRVTMDLTGLASCNILLNFKILGISNGTASIPYTFGDNAATLLAAIGAAISGFTFTGILVSGFNLIFDVDYTSANYTDFFLKVTNSLGDTYTTEVLLDAVSSEKVGSFKPICFCNINNDQQIFATTSSVEPQQILASAPAAMLGMFVQFVTDPMIGADEEVYIYPEIGGTGGFSALCFLTPYFVPGTYIVNGTSLTAVGATGSYYVVRNYRTLSVIGYAQKNQIIDEWNYTELLRSNKLNFRTYKQIQGELDVTSDGIIYNFTDFLNQIKRLIYKGDLFTGGFLTPYNTEAIYDLDTIDVESGLQLGVNTAKVTLSIPTFAGGIGVTGSKKESCYAAFVRFKTNDGAYTTYSKASNVLWLHSSDVRDHQYGSNSGLSLNILIEQIDTEIFNFVQVSIIEFTTSSFIGYSLPEVQVTGESMIIRDNGFDPESYIDFNNASVLLEQIPFVFENARSILGYNNYILAANVNLYQEYDLTAWAQTIALTVSREFVEIGSEAFYGLPENTISTIFRGINSIDRCSSRYMSYMPYDQYRFCVFIDWENGSPTSTYWIDDVDFDGTVTGLGDFIISTVSGVFSTIQYIVEADQIDMDYILPDGKVLRDVVKDIRFGRALCNPQVQTTGFGAHVFNDGSDDYVSGFDDAANIQTSTKLALYSNDYQNTSQVFNYQAGDFLQTSLMNNEATTVTSTNNYGISFIGNLASAPVTTDVDKLENISFQNDNTIALYKYTNGGDTISIRNSAAVELDTAVDDGLINAGQYFFYIRPYSGGVAYPENPSQTRFFVIPQNQWYNKETHDSSTVYKLYGGDAFPTLSSYKIAENETDQTVLNTMFTYWHFNRTNAALRTGLFPYKTLTDYLKDPYLTTVVTTDFPYDQYRYDAVFTPRYPFQNRVAFNPLLPQITNKFSSIYYSGIGFGSDLSGGNRIWLPLDTKQLESKYGAITDMKVLFGLSGQNILMVWQERRFTAQYFDNTANIVSNSGELLIGSGKILERQGQDLSEYGCQYKWLIQKGQGATGKDIVYWVDFRKGAIMRFGADGSSNIIGNLAQLINNETMLAVLNQYTNDDAPAQFLGCHATWDNINKEYILTLRLAPKETTGNRWEIGQFRYSTTEFWGFEQFPVIYKSLINNNLSTPPNANWETISGYDSEYFEILTIVWSENDNKFKTFRTYTPKIYGQWNNTFVSSHPTQNNLIFEHNDVLSEALYYCVMETTAVTANTDPALFRITGTGIESTFPSPFAPSDRQKYVVRINGKNYEVVGTGTDYLQMANVDDDDILPQVTIANFSYSVCNSQDPYITTVASNGNGRYFHFAVKEVQADDSLKRTEYEAGYSSIATPQTRSFTNKLEEDFDNGKSNVQIKQDTTNDPTDNEVSLNSLEGMWAKVKNIWRWGKSNRVQTIEIQALETQKTK
jgi:hypothetical protein